MVSQSLPALALVHCSLFLVVLSIEPVIQLVYLSILGVNLSYLKTFTISFGQIMVI